MKLKAVSDRIKELSKLTKETDIEEISYIKDGLKLGIKKMPEVSAEKNKEKGLTPQKKKKEDVQKERRKVHSHSVGHFRDFILPSRKALAKKGQYVKKGHKLGMIESMKIMKDILSPHEGKIVEKFVKHGDAVEYGQDLFEIEIV
ncbi:MAG: acetyl-CoA carboxylase biotin carboxyl carrier protein [Elusimicrobiota bacterium]